MNNQEVGGKRKRSRGKAYDIDKVMELHDKGYTYKQIADELNIKSVQSLRHSVEKILKKKSKSKHNNNKTLHSNEDDEDVQWELAHRDRAPVVTGIMDTYADNETLALLEFLWDNMGLPHDKIGKLNRFYFPYPYENLVDNGPKDSFWDLYRYLRDKGRFHSKNPIDNLREIFHFLGFYGTVESGEPKGNHINIYHSHPYGTKEFSRDLIINGPFQKKWNGFESKIRTSLTYLISRGLVDATDLNKIEIEDYMVNRYRVLRSLYYSGLYFKLHYDSEDYLKEFASFSKLYHPNLSQSVTAQD